MRTTLPLLLSLFLVGCGAGASSAYRKSAPSSPPPPSYPDYSTGAVAGVPGVDKQAEVQLSAKSETTTVAMAGDAIGALDEDSGGGGGSSANASAPAPVEPQQGTEMFDIEARVSIEVEKVTESAVKLREIAKKHGGQVVADTVNDDGAYAGASFTLRIPSQGSDKFLDEIGGIGAVRSRQITARDIGKQYHDAQIHLKNLELTLKRYEDILAKAQDVKAILEIEREMTRVRGEIDRVKGDLRWMKDRVARATVYVTLYANRPESTTFNPKAKVYPGLRFLHLADFRGDAGNTGFWGTGLSIGIVRQFSIDIDVMRKIGSSTKGVDLLLLTLGGEFYSDFLGAGRREWLNPYIGLRVGYARMLGKDEMAAGGTIGVEIYKTKFIRLDAQTRLLALFANKQVGGHLAVQSGLSISVAF